MKNLRRLEHRCIAALGLDHCQEYPQRRSIRQRCVGSRIARFRRTRLTAQVNHPSGKDQRKFAQVGIVSIALRRPFAAHQVHGFHQLNKVSSRCAQRLAHVGQQRNRLRPRGFGRRHQQGRQIL